jgi:hypothetical protein
MRCKGKEWRAKGLLALSSSHTDTPQCGAALMLYGMVLLVEFTARSTPVLIFNFMPLSLLEFHFMEDEFFPHA